MHRPTAAAVLASCVLTVAKPALAAGDPERPTVIVEADGGFDWLDAGVGAASMLALIAVICGGVLLRRAVVRPESGREHS
jgi:hypothetical protein